MNHVRNLKARALYLTVTKTGDSFQTLKKKKISSKKASLYPEGGSYYRKDNIPQQAH